MFLSFMVMILFSKSPSSAYSVTKLKLANILPKGSSLAFKKRLFVSDNVGVFDAGENSDFVQCVVFLFFSQG